MSNTFSPSINIVRDLDKKIEYIPTTNSRGIYHQIASNFNLGVHSFNIIGSYGTGKSAFLLALAKHLTGERTIFDPVNGQFNGCKKFKFVNIVGQSQSIIEGFAETLKVEPKETSIFDKIKKEHSVLKKKDTCLVIFIDEFGKFLEFAAKNNPDQELYFIQRLAEYVNDNRRNILFISTLHQNFDAYAVGLSETERKEWEKVKGRLTELTFNEPVEQLLQLAAQVIAKKNYKKRPLFKAKLLKLINETGTFNLLKNIDKDFVNSLFPFDILAAMTLTLSLQRYGQNERSLFNFLQTDEYLGLNSFEEIREQNPYYNLDCVYNYLQFNYYSVLTSRYNPDYFKWTVLRNSLDRVELEFTKHTVEAQKLVKTIGLLDILGSNAAKITAELIDEYAKVCLGIKNAKSILNDLERFNIIRFQAFKNRYKLFEGTDIDIEEIQDRARKEISNIVNLSAELQPYFQYSFIPAKAVTYQKGTPRIFKYQLSSEPIKSFVPTSREIDGIINLVFSDKLQKDDFDNEHTPIIYGYFTNTSAIEEQLIEIKTIEKALTMISNDLVAKNELKELQRHLINTLNNELNNSFFGESTSVAWYYNGEEINFTNKRKFNSFLSKIISELYSETPVFRNELMNKTKVSSSIHYAKKQFIEALINNYHKENLGFEGKQMPAEKTIYNTLLKNTGIHSFNGVHAEFKTPTEASTFIPLWKASVDFLESTKVSRKDLTQFINVLSAPPFSIKDGLLEFWLISFLFIQREDFALFRNGLYVPRLTKEVVELLYREAKKFEIKAFDIQGVKLDLFNKYRELTQQKDNVEVTGSSFQATAKPFLVFYKKLSNYTKQTTSLSHDALAFRKVIKDAKELEKTFFEDLPSCFGLNMSKLSDSEKDLNIFVDRISSCIAELRTAEDNLISRIEASLLNILGLKKSSFNEYQQLIQKRYKSIKTHILNTRQKTFLNRINSKLPDRKAWLNSLVQSLIGKQINNIADAEEALVNERFQIALSELDNYVELSRIEVDDAIQTAYKIDIQSTNQDSISKNIIVSKEQSKQLKSLEKEMLKVLNNSTDKNVNQAVLIKLLKELYNG